MILDESGNLYGTTYNGGASSVNCPYGCGTVFEMSPGKDGEWTETLLYSFQGYAQDGMEPAGGLVFDAAGNLYGTTMRGGAHGEGTVFKLARQKGGGFLETVLYSFCSVGTYCSDGSAPVGGVVLDSGGNLYGTTSFGGLANGTVFELTPGANGQWSERVLHAFLGSEGSTPFATLIVDTAGNLYGMTGGPNGGPFCSGLSTAFELSLGQNGTWSFSVLHSFPPPGGQDGSCSTAPLVRDGAGHLYGTTYLGGAYGAGTVFALAPGPAGGWVEKILHSFDINDGAQPYAGLILDEHGNLLGTLSSGGRNGFGSVFKLTPDGQGRWTETILHDFTGLDGTSPYAGLVSDHAGHLYGTTYYGGYLSDCYYDGCGVVFEVTP